MTSPQDDHTVTVEAAARLERTTSEPYEREDRPDAREAAYDEWRS